MGFCSQESFGNVGVDMLLKGDTGHADPNQEKKEEGKVVFL